MEHYGKKHGRVHSLFHNEEQPAKRARPTTNDDDDEESATPSKETKEGN